MGLTGGIADVGSLYDSLVGIHAGKADEAILDTYDETRRKIWHEVVNPVSTSNMRRLIADPGEAVEKDPFFKMLKQMQENPGAQPQAGSVSTLTYKDIMSCTNTRRLSHT